MPDFDGGSVVRRGGRGSEKGANSAMPLKADIDPPPKPWPFVPAIALLLVLAFVSLQFFLPVTHVRHPADPYRNWIPVDHFKSNKHKIVSDSDSISSNNSEVSDGTLIVVMTKETDLRPAFVVINSTISNTREPEKLQFCIIVPSKLLNSQTMKLKAVFSNLKVEVLRDGFVIEKMKTFMVAESIDDENSKALDLVPLYLPKMFPSFERFIYLESDSVLQGDIEELIQLDMHGNPVAAVEDCSQIFETFFSLDLLEAARLSSGNVKPRMPAEPYEPKTCIFDKGSMVLDPKVWNEKNITEAVQWWIAMYYKTGETLYSNGHLELPLHLALYRNYTKVNDSWNVREPLTFKKANAAKLLHFDKQHKPWHQTKPANFEKDITGLWWKYLSPSTNMMFLS